jgi:hypothetical protein
MPDELPTLAKSASKESDGIDELFCEKNLQLMLWFKNGEAAMKYGFFKSTLSRWASTPLSLNKLPTAIEANRNEISGTNKQ